MQAVLYKPPLTVKVPDVNAVSDSEVTRGWFNAGNNIKALAFTCHKLSAFKKIKEAECLESSPQAIWLGWWPYMNNQIGCRLSNTLLRVAAKRPQWSALSVIQHSNRRVSELHTTVFDHSLEPNRSLKQFDFLHYHWTSWFQSLTQVYGWAIGMAVLNIPLIRWDLNNLDTELS